MCPRDHRIRLGRRDSHNPHHKIILFGTHFLARKGDEASDTLQELLRLRNPSSISSSSSFFGARLFRLDVVNGGAKTPLDVAVACELSNRKDGSSDTQYKKVISYLHDSIVEEADELEKRMNL